MVREEGREEHTGGSRGVGSIRENAGWMDG